MEKQPGMQGFQYEGAGRRNFRRSRSRENSHERANEGAPDLKFEADKKTKVYVSNLPISITDEELKEEFSNFGDVIDVKVIRKTAMGQPHKDFCYAFVVLSTEKSEEDIINNFKIVSRKNWNVGHSKEKSRDNFGNSDRGDKYHSMGYGGSKFDKGPKSKFDNPQGSRFSKERDYGGNFNKGPGHASGNAPRKSNFYPPSSFGNFSAPREQPNNGGGFSSFSDPIKSLSQDYNEPKIAGENFIQGFQMEKSKDGPPQWQQDQQSVLLGNVRVRELWIGNLPQDCGQNLLEKNLEIFGPIENVELFTKSPNNFAFVRFKKVAEATKAFESSSTLALLLSCPNLKMAFSDHQRRTNIVGDTYGSQEDESLTSVLYVGYSSNSSVPDEGVLREELSKYGEITQVVRKIPHQAMGLRSYVLVEYSNLDDAKEAYRKLHKDKHGDKKQRLGDKKCEVAILVKPKRTVQNNLVQPSTGMANPGFHQQSKFTPSNQIGSMTTPGQQNINPAFIQNNQKPSNFNQNYQNFSNPNNMKYQSVPTGMAQGYPIQNQQPPQGQVLSAPVHPSQQFIQNPPAYQMNMGGGGVGMPQRTVQQQPPPQQQGSYAAPQQGYGTSQGNSSGQGFQQGSNFQQNQGGRKGFYNNNMGNEGRRNYHNQGGYGNNNYGGNSTGYEESRAGLEFVQKLISAKPTKEPEPEAPTSRFKMEVYDDDGKNEEDGTHFWSGFITRSKQHRVGVDAALISGEEITLTEYNLNISHRTTYEEALRKKNKAVAVFRPSNETQHDIFKEYINYFLEKNRSGVVTLRTMLLYLLPPCEEASYFRVLGEREILGLFCDINAETRAELPVKMTNSQTSQLRQGSLQNQPKLAQQTSSNIVQAEDEIDINELNDLLSNNPEILNNLE